MKNIYIQKIRGILILLVVAIHSITESNVDFENYILIFCRNVSNVAVPIFIFLSGFYYNNEKNLKNKNYLKGKIKRLFIPLIIWDVLYFMLFTNHSIEKLITFKSAPHLYYILVLIQLILLTPLIQKMVNKKNFVWLITPIYLILYRVLWFTNGESIIPFQEYYFLGWLIYYMFGLYTRQNHRSNTIKIKSLIILFIIVYLYSLFIYNNYGFNYAISQMNVVNMIMSIFVCKYILSKIHINTKSNIISKIGDKSFGIYFLHIFVLKVVGRITSLFITNAIILFIVKVLFTIITSYIIIIIFNKITKNKFNYLLGF